MANLGHGNRLGSLQVVTAQFTQIDTQHVEAAATHLQHLRQMGWRTIIDMSQDQNIGHEHLRREVCARRIGKSRWAGLGIEAIGRLAGRWSELMDVTAVPNA